MEGKLVNMAKWPGSEDTQHSRHRYMPHVNPADVVIDQGNCQESPHRVSRPADQLAEPEPRIAVRMENLDERPDHQCSRWPKALACCDRWWLIARVGPVIAVNGPSLQQLVRNVTAAVPLVAPQVLLNATACGTALPGT